MDRDIGLANEDGAGIDKAFGGQRCGLRRAVGEVRNTLGGRRSGDLDELLERHRNAGKGPQGIAAGNRGINPAGGITGTIGVHPDDRIQRRIMSFYPLQVMLEEFDGADLFGGNASREFVGRLEVEVCHEAAPWRL
jgi:hypothetical protein